MNSASGRVCSEGFHVHPPFVREKLPCVGEELRCVKAEKWTKYLQHKDSSLVENAISRLVEL
eukprot:1239417-Amphidinium_carterae.1